MPESEHPHGLSDRDFDSLFTVDKPVIFNFHSYASLITSSATAAGIMTTFMCADTKKRSTSTRLSNWPSLTRWIASTWLSTSLIVFRVCGRPAHTSKNG
jgi:phosphoketolase